MEMNYLTVQPAGKALLLRCENKDSPVLSPGDSD